MQLEVQAPMQEINFISTYLQIFWVGMIHEWVSRHTRDINWTNSTIKRPRQSKIPKRVRYTTMHIICKIREYTSHKIARETLRLKINYLIINLIFQINNCSHYFWWFCDSSWFGGWCWGHLSWSCNTIASYGSYIAVVRSILCSMRLISPCFFLSHCNYKSVSLTFNPLTPTVIQKLLKIIGRVRLCPSCSFATALDSDINQTTGSGGHLSMWENRCMHAAVCLLRAGQPRSAGDAAKSGQFIGQFSWVTGDPIGVKGLTCAVVV